LALFLFASLLCGIAPSGKSLVAARLLQGVGASLFMPSSLSLLAHTYTDDRKRAAMLGLWSAMVGFAAATGPLIGGLLIHVLGWRSVFWINVPLGLLGIPAAPKQPHPLSWVSHAVGAIILAALSVFLIEGPPLGWHSPIVLAAAVVALIASAILVGRERTSSATLLPRALRRMPGFSAVNLTGFLTNLGAFGQLFLLSLYLQGLGSRDPLETGLQLVPTMATVTVGNFLSSRVSARFGTRRTMCVGYTIAAALGMAILIAGRGTPLRLLVGVSAMNFFVGMAIPAMTTTAMQIAGRTYANGAAAALNANRQIGALVGVALMGAVIHSASSWDARLVVGFATIASSYAAAALFVYRFVGRR
jgi:DHA2 family methylenomycin A resistance protein-like MFS transporter